MGIQSSHLYFSGVELLHPKKTWSHLELDLLKVVGESKTISPHGGFSWWWIFHGSIRFVRKKLNTNPNRQSWQVGKKNASFLTIDQKKIHPWTSPGIGTKTITIFLQPLLTKWDDPPSRGIWILVTWNNSHLCYRVDKDEHIYAFLLAGNSANLLP